MFEFDAVSPSVIRAEPADAGDSETNCAPVNGPPDAPAVRSTVTDTPAIMLALEEAATTDGAVTRRLKVFDEVCAVGVV